MSKYDRDIQDVYAVKQLGDAIGYGHLMAIAHELWARHLEDKGLPRRGAHCVVGYPMVKEEYQTEALNDPIYTYIVDKALKADRKTEKSSEKPNNCEHITEDGVTCAKYPACDDCLDNPLNKVKGSERLVKGSEQTDCLDRYDRKTEPTISKMEQVEDAFKEFATECNPTKARKIGHCLFVAFIDEDEHWFMGVATYPRWAMGRTYIDVGDGKLYRSGYRL